jgi:2-methylaconitate cis-trans-isomerase PrpF
MTVQYVVTTGSIGLTAATAKTMIELATTANVPVEWIAADITFDGVTASAVPVRVDFCTYAATGTGTAATNRRLGQAVGTSQTTSKINDTVEPTTPTILFSWFIPPTSGVQYIWPLGRELFQNVSTIQGIRLTAAAAVNAIVNLTFEE